MVIQMAGQLCMCVCISAEITPWQGWQVTNSEKGFAFPRGNKQWLPPTNPHTLPAPPPPDLLPLLQTFKGFSKRHINFSLGYYCGNFDGCLYTAQTKPALDYVVLTLLMLKSNLYGVTGTPQKVLNPSWRMLVKSSDPANRNRSLPKVVELRLQSTIFKHII